jgi:hypothetical protein
VTQQGSDVKADFGDVIVDEYAIGEPGAAARGVRPDLPAVRDYVADTVLDATAAGSVDLRAASVRGLMHRYDGTPRQDAYSFVRQQDPDALVVTVCDGVGSLERSHEAAELVSQRLASALTRDAGTGGLRWAEAFASVSGDITHLRDHMATTVVCAVVTELADGRHRAELAWIGDSAAYLLSASTWHAVGGSVKTIDAGDGPLTTTTKALPSRSVSFSTADIEFGVGDGLFLMTDGVADPLGSGRGDVGSALADWWSTPPDKFTFGAQVDFARRSFDDDRTVVGVWPAGRDGSR